MEPLTLKHQQQPTEDIMENWDDDGDFQGLDDLHFRNVSSTTAASGQPQRRDSVTSRTSMRSDRDSQGGGDEDWDVVLSADDEKSTAEAIISAKSAGIPIPQNVPASALRGGTIKRLGGRRVKKALVDDDWGEDVEMPKPQEGGLRFTKADASNFPDASRGFSAEFLPTSPSPSKPESKMSFMDRLASATKARTGAATLDKFKDDEDDDFFGDVPTIKIAKNRSPPKPMDFVPPTPKPRQEVDDMEDDLEFPDDGQPLRLSLREETPHTPATNFIDDSDMEWAEGSLGTRFGGTRRDMRSNPSSSISAFSPSASSCFTAESEDDGLEGLILPDSGFKFGEALRKRMEYVETEFAASKPPKVNFDPPAERFSRRVEARTESPRDFLGTLTRPLPPTDSSSSITEDFFTGIDIGDGEVFDSSKLTLNRNIKHTKMERQYSPLRRVGISLTFTNQANAAAGPSRIPIPRPQSRDRPRSTLESVSESGPAPQYRRSASRLGHSAHSSSSSIPTPLSSSKPNVTAPSTPSRRGLSSKASHDVLRPQNTTHPSNYLKAKRSMPVMPRQQASPARQPAYQRPPSRGSDYSVARSSTSSRPKTPVDRSGAESSLSNARKQQPKPFLPAGTTPSAQSHHISVKSSRHHFNRPGSSDSGESGLANRPLSRLSHSHRPITPTNGRHAPESLTREAASKRTLTKPTRRRAFGDGNELDTFDDLPTSASNESKYMKQPIARGAPKSVQLRSRLGLQQTATTGTATKAATTTTTINTTAAAATATTTKAAVTATDAAAAAAMAAATNTATSTKRPSPPLRMAIPGSPTRAVPSFARDTNASRIARGPTHPVHDMTASTPNQNTTATTSINRPSPPLRMAIPGSPTRAVPKIARDTNASRIAREQTHPIFDAAVNTPSSNLPTTAPTTIDRPSPPLRMAIPGSPTRPTPHFARDTNASRQAREHRMGSVSATLHAAPSLPIVRETSAHTTILNPRSNARMETFSERLTTPIRHPRRRPKATQQKPHLIKPLGHGHNQAKELNDMKYDPSLYTWQGNESALDPFEWMTDDAQSQAPFENGAPSLADGHNTFELPGSANRSPTSAAKPTPALICNLVGANKAPRMVDGMVFDPEQMKWLKAAPGINPGEIEEEDDPFADIETLTDTQLGPAERYAHSCWESSYGTEKAIAETREGVDELPVVAESFDVGPGFVGRCRSQSLKRPGRVISWLRKVEEWVEGGVERVEIRGKGRN